MQSEKTIESNPQKKKTKKLNNSSESSIIVSSTEKETSQENKKLQLSSYDDFRDALEKTDYIAEDDLAMLLFIATKLGKPILIEGPPGTGKTELAKIASQILNRDLIRVQCYEGIDESQLLYEWQYSKQLLYSSIFKEKKELYINKEISELEFIQKFNDQLFTESFLLKRPITQAILSEEPQVLLIDEIDRADQEIEAMLLEVLSENQISIPEIGTLKGKSQPLVILTSNNSRKLSEALRRRCLFYYTQLPTYEFELKIINKKFPTISKDLAESVCRAIQKLRSIEDLEKIPNIAETIDWLKTLLLLNKNQLSTELIKSSLSILLKNQGDIEKAKHLLDETQEKV